MEIDMKYNIHINQKALSGTQLDIKDAAILDYLITYCNSESPRIKKERFGESTWINYDTLIQEMPLLRITTRQAITPRIKTLETEGYIITKLRTVGGMKRLFVKLTDKVDSLFMELTEPVQNISEPIHETLPNHYTIDNYTKDNSETPQRGALPENFGSTRLKRILKVYSRLWSKKYNLLYKPNYPRFGGALKGLDDLTEIQIASLLFIHFEWAGMDGSDTFQQKRMHDATYPFEWLVRAKNTYLAYIKNVVKIDPDDQEGLYEFVGKQINKLSTD
jgi:hypothetical protein